MENEQRYVYATFLWRLLALIIDQLILLIPVMIVALTAGVMIGIFAPNFDETAIEAGGNVIGILASWLYYAIMESSGKQATYGKLICGLKVTDLNGERISFMRATGRHFAKIISGVILLIGYIMVLFTERKQGLHDMMAGCLVLKRAKSGRHAQFNEAQPGL
ncbi:MAG: RDD family protein [Pseudomonadota bacterium]